MDQRKLTFLITHILLRIRDYPPEAVDELLAALDRIEAKYGLEEKLSEREWQVVVESRQDVVEIEHPEMKGPRYSTLSKAARDEIGKRHFDIAMKCVRMRDAEEQGDISDLLFALLDEYFLDIPDFWEGWK